MHLFISLLLINFPLCHTMEIRKIYIKVLLCHLEVESHSVQISNIRSQISILGVSIYNPQDQIFS